MSSNYFSVLMTEAYTSSEYLALYHGDGDRKGAHFSFNFFLIGINTGSTAYDIVNSVNSWMAIIGTQLTPNWVVSIVNHSNSWCKLDIFYTLLRLEITTNFEQPLAMEKKTWMV